MTTRARDDTPLTTIVFFNNKGGVGKTSLVYHLAWMYSRLGVNVLAADLDPQANLTSMFLDDEEIEPLWPESGRRRTVYGALRPLLEGTGDVAKPYVAEPAPGLGLVAGDLLLSSAEDDLSSQWSACLDRKERAFRVLSALARILRRGAAEIEARLILVHAGPSLDVPEGAMRPIGYIVMQRAVRLDRPVKAYARWMARIPEVYREAVAGNAAPVTATAKDGDPNCLASLKHYSSLMPLAQEARKPMFLLKSADGAIGGHMAAVQDCYRDFRALAEAVAERAGVSMTPP